MRPLRALWVFGIAAAFALSGCTAPSAYPAELASRLQQAVLEVTQAAADGDAVAALLRLEELQASVLNETAKGNLDPARRDSIIAAIDLVSGDLEAMRAAQEEAQDPDPSGSTGGASGSGDQGGSGNGNNGNPNGNNGNNGNGNNGKGDNGNGNNGNGNNGEGNGSGNGRNSNGEGNGSRRRPIRR